MADTDMDREWSRRWTTTVWLGLQMFSPKLFVTTHGPANFKIDSEGNLHIQEYMIDGTEIDVALVLAGNFGAVTQEIDEPSTAVLDVLEFTDNERNL